MEPDKVCGLCVETDVSMYCSCEFCVAVDHDPLSFFDGGNTETLFNEIDWVPAEGRPLTHACITGERFSDGVDTYEIVGPTLLFPPLMPIDRTHRVRVKKVGLDDDDEDNWDAHVVLKHLGITCAKM